MVITLIVCCSCNYIQPITCMNNEKSWHREDMIMIWSTKDETHGAGQAELQMCNAFFVLTLTGFRPSPGGIFVFFFLFCLSVCLPAIRR